MREDEPMTHTPTLTDDQLAEAQETAAELRTHVDFDQLWEFLRGYRGWVAGTVASDPN